MQRKSTFDTRAWICMQTALVKCVILAVHSWSFIHYTVECRSWGKMLLFVIRRHVNKTLFCILADGSSGFKAEKGRYHLYVSLACPFAHRTLIVLALKGLQDVISYTAVDRFLGPKGWKFNSTVSTWTDTQEMLLHWLHHHLCSRFTSQNNGTAASYITVHICCYYIFCVLF